MKLILLSSLLYAHSLSSYGQTNLNQIVSAIYAIEGGSKTHYPYGISRYGHITTTEAKQICANTVRNNYRRWQVSSQKDDYYAFLSKKYDPLNAIQWRRMLVITLNKQH